MPLAIHVVQNRRAGEQKSHWDNTNELFESMGLQQYVNEPIHESGHTLDLIITRQCDSLLANIPVTGCLFSDHSTLICDLTLDKPPLPKKKISFRKTKVVDVNLLCDDLSTTSLCTDSPDARNDLVKWGVDKTRNMEHSGTCRNIPEHPGTSRNMKKFKKL